MNTPGDERPTTDEPDSPGGSGRGAAVAAKLRRVRRTVGMCGVGVTGQLVLQRVLPHERLRHDRVRDVRAFDAEHGVETTEIVPPSELGITGVSGEHAVEYSPTAVKSFHFMMERIGIDPSDYAFVDIGSGKGLVMLLASDYPFRRIIGVEASAQLCEVARSNVAAYDSPSQRCTNLEVLEGDATAFAMPEENTVFYLCNPFGPVVLERFLDQLERSLRAHPRHVLLVYDNPFAAYSVLDRHPVLRQVENYETISPDYTWCYYENAQHPGAGDEGPDEPKKGVLPGRAGDFFDGWPVPFEPSLRSRAAIGATPGSDPVFPLDREGVAYTFNGASAIFNAAEVLGLEPRQNVLCPAYNCGHEIEPLLGRGHRVELFAVGDDLRVDTDDLVRQIDGDTGAVLVTHYFGFAQPIDEIRAICDEHGLFLIEDCAHGLASEPDGRPLGTVGDVSVFSLRKTLAIPNGGALVVNDARRQPDLHLRTPPAPATWNKFVDRRLGALRTDRALGSSAATLSLAALLPIALGRKVVSRLPVWGDNAWYDTDSLDFETDPEIYRWQMSGVSRRILERADLGEVRASRRRNYEWLVDALGNDVVTPVHPDLPDGVCPLLCPVFAPDAEELETALHSRGIETMRWWSPEHPAVNWDEHPRELALKRRIIALPIHQDLDQRQLRMIADAVRSHR